jgi:hypothetical protein
MADDQPTTEHDQAATAASTPPPPDGQSPLGAAASDEDPFAERPEAFVGAAFAGGLALALILRRFAR